MCSRAGPPSAQWSRGPSLGLDSGRRHMDYRTEGNMDFVVQHQLKLKVSFLLVSLNIVISYSSTITTDVCTQDDKGFCAWRQRKGCCKSNLELC